MQQVNSHSGKQIHTTGAVFVALFLLVTLVSFLVSSSTTDRAFKRGDHRLMELFDSGVYLNTARTILEVSAQSKKEVSKTRQKELADMIILDGPVLPIVSAAAIFVGRSVQMPDLKALAVMESCIQAILSALIFILCWRITGNKFLAFATALTWALYPPAIIATQRLVTENICAAILLALLLGLDVALTKKVNKFNHLFPLACSGFFCGLLLLTKPVLIFSAVLPLSFVIGCLRGKSAVTGILAFGCTTIISMLPFWIFTQQATGHVCYLPQRMPILNAIVGNSLITDGLTTLPSAPAPHSVLKSDSLPFVELTLFMEDPLAHAELDIRKLPRIFAEPWNDFRRTAVLPNALSIRLAHQLFGAFAWGALVLAFAAAIEALQTAISKGSKHSSDIPDLEKERFNKTAKSVCLLFLAIIGHLIYILFEGIPRYGFTAMPLLLILTFWCMAGFIKSGLPKLMTLSICVPAILLGLVANFGRLQILLKWIGSPIFVGIGLAITYIVLAAWLMLALINASKISFKPIDARLMKIVAAVSFMAFSIITTLSVIKETTNSYLISKLSAAQLATREIDLTAGQKSKTNSAVKPDWVLLLIDSDKEVEGSTITFNGHKISDSVMSIYQFFPLKYDLLAVLEELTMDVKMKVEDARQWRAVPIPAEYVNLGGKNKITIAAPPAQPLTIYGDYSEIASNALPTFEYFSHSRIFVDAGSKEWRPKTEFLTACPSISFIESNDPQKPLPPNPDLTSAAGIQRGRLRMLVAMAFPEPESAPAVESQIKSLPLSSLTFQDVSSEPLQNKVIQTGNRSSESYLRFDTHCQAQYQLTPHKQATHLVVELKGKARSQAGEQKQAAVTISLHGTEVKPTDGKKQGTYRLFFDSKGLPKPNRVCLASAMQMLSFNKEATTPINIKAIYPIDAVRGRADHLIIQFLPVPAGTEIKVEEAELSLTEITWPDLRRGKAIVY